MAKRRKKEIPLDWKDGVIAILWLLLWTTNRRRIKPHFELSHRTDAAKMVPTFVGLTEGAIDPGNGVEILQNGRYFDRLLDDIGAAKESIHIETYIWWTGDICVRIASALAKRASEGVEVRLMLDYSGSSRADHKLLKMLRDANKQFGQTVLMITHNPEAAEVGDCIIHMRDGSIVTAEEDPQWVKH